MADKQLNLYLLDKGKKTVGVLSNRMPFSLPFYDDFQTRDLDEQTDYLELKVPANHKDAVNVVADNYILYPDKMYGFKLYRIKELNDVRDGGTLYKSVYAEISAQDDLIKDVVRPVTFNSAQIDEVVESILAGSDWVLGEVMDDFGLLDITIDDYPNKLEALVDVAAQYGAEINYEYEVQGTTVTKQKVSLYREIGQKTGKTFRVGKDLKGVERTEDTSKLVTALIGVGKVVDGKPMTFHNQTEGQLGNFYGGFPEGYEKPNNADYVGSLKAVEKYSRDGEHIIGVYKDTEAESSYELFQNTFEALQKYEKPLMTYKTTVALLAKVAGFGYEEVGIGDTILVVDGEMVPELYVEARIRRMSVSITQPQEDSVELGDYIAVIPPATQRLEELQKKVRAKEETWNQAEEIPQIKQDLSNLPTMEDVFTSSSQRLQVRYVRDWINGSDANNANHWVELKVLKQGVNIAEGIVPTSNSQSLQDAERATDGTVDSSFYARTDAGHNYIQIDLGEVVTDVEYIHAWHYYFDGRTYQGHMVDVSEDGVNWTRIFDSERNGRQPESSGGHIIPVNSSAIIRQQEQKQSEVVEDVKNLKDFKLSTEAELPKKVNITDYNSKVQQLEQNLADKAGLEYVNGQLVDKANKNDTYTKTEVNNALKGKVSTSEYSTDQEGIVDRFESVESSVEQTVNSLSFKVSKDEYNRGIQSTTMPKLLTFYGYPIAINSAWDVDVAVQEYIKYDYIILGDTYQDPNHEEYASTTAIIEKIKILSPETVIFGYIPLGKTTQNRTISTLLKGIDDWHNAGVHGIFADEFGYDYRVSRERQNAIVDHAHSYGMPVFANSWVADYVFKKENIYIDWEDFDGNPNNIPTSIGAEDYVMIESFMVNDWYAENDSRNGFMDKWAHEGYTSFFNYRKQFGTKILAQAIMDDARPDLQKKVEMSFATGVLYSLDAVGYARTDFGAGNPNLFTYKLPSMNVGDDYYDAAQDVAHADYNGVYWGKHTRVTGKGEVTVITDSDNNYYDAIYPRVDQYAEERANAYTDGEVDGVKTVLKDLDTEIKQTAEDIKLRATKDEVKTIAKAENAIAFRYMRYLGRGNTVNSGNHLVEIQAYKNEENIAQGATVTSGYESATGLNYVTDGQINSSNYAELGSTYETGWAMVDLGGVYEAVESIKVWTYFHDNRTYSYEFQISEDGINWISLYDSDRDGEYASTDAGFEIFVNQQKAIYSYASQIRVNSEAITSKADSAIVDDLGTRLQSAEEKIEDDAIITTVMKVDSPLIEALNEKADSEELSDYAKAKRLEEMEKAFAENYATKSELEQSDEDFNFKFKSGGGVNLLKNSVGFAGTDFWTVTGGAETVQNAELEAKGAGSGFMLSSSSIKQSIPVNGGDYTISLKVKKGSSGSGYLKISYDDGQVDEVSFDSGTSYDYDIVERYINVSGNQIEVELYGTGASNIIFTNLMVNTGKLPLQWQHSTGEVYNSNVTINRNGIKVFSSEYNGFTSITPEEFAGYYEVDGQQEKVFTLNKDVTVMSKADIDKEITMSPIKVVPIQTSGLNGWAFVADE